MANLRNETCADILHNQPFKELNFKDFTKNEALGIGVPVVMVIKDQDRLARSARLIKTHSEQKGFHGRAGFREYLPGFCYITELTKNLDISDKSRWFKELPEPRSLVFIGNDIVLTAAEDVHIFDTISKKENLIKNPYFGNLHTTFPNFDNTRIIVSSTGFDSLLELDSKTKKETWRWTAWEHGYNRAANGSFITLNSQEAIELREAGNEVVLVDDSVKKEGFGIPTAFRTTHINGAIYDYDPNFILATLYHKGTVVRINRQSGESEILMRDLKNPHAVQKDNGGYIVTDTSHGVWYQLNRDFSVKTKLSFTDFPGKPEEMKEIEWVQYVSPLSNGLYIAADANRQSAWVFDPKKQEYNQIIINPNWSVQAILPIEKREIDILTQWK